MAGSGHEQHQPLCAARTGRADHESAGVHVAAPGDVEDAVAGGVGEEEVTGRVEPELLASVAQPGVRLHGGTDAATAARLQYPAVQLVLDPGPAAVRGH